MSTVEWVACAFRRRADAVGGAYALEQRTAGEETRGESAGVTARCIPVTANFTGRPVSREFTSAPTTRENDAKVK